MTNLDLKAPTDFIGHLSLGTDTIDLTFQLHITSSGELKLDFPKLPLNDQTAFIRMENSRGGSTYANFNLAGVANDGTRLHSDELQLTSVNWNQFEIGDERITIEGRCSIATLVRPCNPAMLPRLTMQLKGFANYGSLHATCPLGKLVMNGKRRNVNADPNVLCGWVIIEAEETPPDIAIWRQDASKLLDHIRVVMSLAAASMLKAPVRHFHFNERFEIELWLQGTQDPDPLRIIPDMSQKTIFQAAVSSFFSPPIKAVNFNFAVEWFAMNASYNETRLANAMTALENLVNSNLDDSVTFIQPQKIFEKTTRPAMRKLIRACVERWDTEDATNVLAEMNEKLSDLNRRSLARKIAILSERARTGPWRPGLPVRGDHRFRWMTTTCSGRWRPGQQGCGRA